MSGRHESNTLPPLKRRSEFAMFVDQFKQLSVLLLAGSTVLSVVTGGVADGVVILGVILILLRPGACEPADGRVLEAHELSVASRR